MSSIQSKTPRVVLSIAGSDSSGGAGIQADIKAGSAFGVYVATAITAVTAQNAQSVTGIFPMSAAQLEAQIHAVHQSMPIAAVKLGMLGSLEAMACVEAFLKQIQVPVVLDPVLVATSGSELVADSLTEIEAFYKERLFPFATLVTPNLQEAAQILGEDVAETFEQVEQQARALKALGCDAVLLKGGHGEQAKAVDLLLAEGDFPFSSARIDTTHTHGTGCTLSTAIASGLAQGLSLPQAVAAAKTYIQGAIEGSKHWSLVPENGPIHHFYQYW